MRHVLLQEALRCATRELALGRRRCVPVGMQQQQVKTLALSPLSPALFEGDTDSLVGTDGQPREYIAVNLSGGSGSLASNFVWQPGGVAGDGVYTTWATLNAATSAVPGAKTVTVDTSLGAAHITAGGPYNVDDITFVGGIATGVVLINLDAGVTFTAATTNLSLIRCVISSAATATVWTPASGSWTLSLTLSQVLCTAAGAFVENGFNGGVVAMAEGSAIGDGTHAVVKTDAAGVTTVDAFTGSTVNTNALSGIAGGQVTVASDASSTVIQTQGAGPTYSFTVIDPNGTFIFRPGATGTQNGNVFTTWAALFATASARASGGGPITVYVDDSAAAAHVTTGTWNVNNWRFVGNFAAGETLIFDPGAAWTFNAIWLDNGVQLKNTDTVNSPFTPTGTFGDIYMTGDGTAIVAAAGAQPWCSVTATGTVQVFMNMDTALGDGVAGHNAFTVPVGGHLTVTVGQRSAVKAHAIAGLGTATVIVAAEGTVATQDVTTLVTTFDALAAQVAYTPGAGGNWNPVPTLVNAALDQVAASNTAVGVGNTGTGSGTVTVSTANITKAKNGKMLVTASCLCSTSAAATLTITLKRDAATTIGTPKSLVAGAALSGIDVTISATDIAPDNAAHSYQLSVAASAGNLTVAASSAQIEVVEDS